MTETKQEFKERIASVRIAGMPGGTRAGQARVDQINATEDGWDRDMPAYKRLRREGLQPRSIDGSRELEAKANDRLEVENGLLMSKPEIPARMREAREAVAQKDVNV